MDNKTPRRVIFMSHASEDRELAAALQTAIEDAFPGAFEVFNAFGRDSIAPSDEWRAKLSAAVKESSLLLVLLTRNSLGKNWIYWESGGAYHRGIPVLPIVGTGCEMRHLPSPLREIQAVSIQSESGLRRMMDRLAQLSGMTHLSEKYDLSQVARQIGTLQVTHVGKQWSVMARDAICRFFLNATGEAVLDVRIISYTSETLATALPLHFRAANVGTVPVRVRILVRSEYQHFPSRPKDVKFNQRIRWRISRAKADWYQWIRDLQCDAEIDEPVELSVRDYWWDPSVRALLLGRSEGFIGLYSMKFQSLTGAEPREIPPSWDWVAADTAMAPIDSSSQEFIDDAVSWFDQLWDQSNSRTHEAYRCEISDTLLRLAEEKAKSESVAKTLLKRWRLQPPQGTSKWAIGNLALPACFPKGAEEQIDFMACAVAFKNTSDLVLVCEIRQPSETWEGIGKTSTYLDLIGIKPELSVNEERVELDSLEELLEVIKSGATAKWNCNNRDDNSWLFATDFVWLWQSDGCIQVTRPEGEILWGLWDSARYLLRISLTGRGWFEGVQRSQTGKLIQHELFSRLPLRDLHDCYSPVLESQISAIVVLCPDSIQSLEVSRIDNKYAAQRLLAEAIESAPHHPSRFWRRIDAEVQRHNDLAHRIVGQLDLDKLPPIYTVRHRLPFGSVAEAIRKGGQRGRSLKNK